jgi:hypothetical protein
MECNFCHREMTDHSKGCYRSAFIYENPKEKLPAILANKEPICHDCGAPFGSYHHPGCDMERCPRCGGQVISCECGSKRTDDPGFYGIFLGSTDCTDPWDSFFYGPYLSWEEADTVAEAMEAQFKEKYKDMNSDEWTIAAVVAKMAEPPSMESIKKGDY